MRVWRWLVAALALPLWACGGDEPPGTRILMDFGRPTGLYDAPFPADDLIADGVVDVSVFPNPENAGIVEQARALLVGRAGFATTGGVFFQATDLIDPSSLPDIAGSVADDASVFLVELDTGTRYPVEVEFEEFAGLYAAPNMISLLPLQGVPLRPNTRYAGIVTTDVLDAGGAPLDAADAADLPDLGPLGIDPARIAGATVFTTGDPIAEFDAVVDAMLARPLPVPDAPFTRTELFDDFCAYHTTIPMPDYQSGTPPYMTEGGNWELDANGDPVFQREATANLVVTIPRAPMPAGGYPLVVFVRTGGGGDRPLVDRGTRDADGNVLEPGEGPARYFARAGFAGLQVDGPVGGLRNVTGGDEQFLMFNVQNLAALRDNVRESAAELALIAHVAGALRVDATDCPPPAGGDGPAAAFFDTDHFALMGHSMGATIAPLTAAAEPMYGALILSGAGGSWIENIVYKREPLEVAPIIGLLIKQGFDVRTDDPVLSFAQWALEPADPPVFAVDVAPRHVLMQQGIVDNYILPRIANATSLSLGLDLAGEPLDDDGDPRLEGQTPLAPLLPLIDRTTVDLPVSGNRGDATAVVIQHAEDGVEDGHEVVFQTDGAKHQYQCFLQSWLAGTPEVPVAADRDAPCP